MSIKFTTQMKRFAKNVLRRIALQEFFYHVPFGLGRCVGPSIVSVITVLGASRIDSSTNDMGDKITQQIFNYRNSRTHQGELRADLNSVQLSSILVDGMNIFFSCLF